ncbi:hypothetical protein [Carboxylicivirga taeanensis]|uniref:hypothetical protein n=1 Tax=Carboxylicivirga taeanensis TaxID=1416875 RepID=UPI003F6E3156
MKTSSQLINSKSIISVFFITLVLSLGLTAQTSISNEYSEGDSELYIEEWMTDLDAYTFEENHMETEQWMTDLDAYVTDEFEISEVESWMCDLNAFQTEDYNMEIEQWMTDLQSFNTSDEAPLAIEAWMTSLEKFNHDLSFDFYADAEDRMKVEAWMTGLNIFNRASVKEIESITTINLDIDCQKLIALKN